MRERSQGLPSLGVNPVLIAPILPAEPVIPPEASTSLQRDGLVMTPRVGVPNTFLLQNDGVRGNTLRRISTITQPVIEQTPYEQVLIIARKLFTTTGGATKFRIEPEPNECIEVIHVVIVSPDEGNTWDLDQLTQNKAGGGDIQIHLGTVSTTASVSTVVLAIPGSPTRKNGSNQMRRTPGPIILCGHEQKPNGFEKSDVLTVNTTAPFAAGKNLSIAYVARRVPAPAEYIDGSTRVTGTT